MKPDNASGPGRPPRHAGRSGGRWPGVRACATEDDLQRHCGDRRPRTDARRSPVDSRHAGYTIQDVAGQRPALPTVDSRHAWMSGIRAGPAAGTTEHGRSTPCVGARDTVAGQRSALPTAVDPRHAWVRDTGCRARHPSRDPRHAWMRAIRAAGQRPALPSAVDPRHAWMRAIRAAGQRPALPNTADPRHAWMRGIRVAGQRPALPADGSPALVAVADR